MKNELATSLEQLALEAQRYSPQTKQRQIALGRLICLIQRSQKLYCPRGDLSQEVYTYLYQEALQDLWLEVSCNINKYDPSKSRVMTWVNFLLNKRFIDARDRYYQSAKSRLTYVSNISDLDKAIPSEVSLSEEVKQCIEEDPENLFKSKQLKSCPQINFQNLVLHRLRGDSWETLSKEYGVKGSSREGSSNV
ncbi:hypothetical protein JOY44_23790 [Phormidium sp. CLA17]|uniref:sigma-70 family RNA polymerase sigma factor n=1 Tax=Leptolyngbya sp. Cla-17 TaxID=2803751 RepID=UPI0014909BF2|nr:sigma-70 family RNA polymerase sigma factor [Leptolyngbya sp. Cla-17]MBM0744593.1 hypothetical protein [Leptolyngbya sp. Cla-17]